jgi:hypothetical protein
MVSRRWIMPCYFGSADLTWGAHQAGSEVWLATTRPYMRHDSTDPDTRHWLEKNGVFFDHLLYDEDKYHRLAELVDPDRVVMVLEDLPEMFDAAEEFFPGRAVMYENNHNRCPASVRHPSCATLGGALQMALARIETWKERYGQ